MDLTSLTLKITMNDYSLFLPSKSNQDEGHKGHWRLMGIKDVLYSKATLIIFYGQGVLRHDKKGPDMNKKQNPPGGELY